MFSVLLQVLQRLICREEDWFLGLVALAKRVLLITLLHHVNRRVFMSTFNVQLSLQVCKVVMKVPELISNHTWNSFSK